MKLTFLGTGCMVPTKQRNHFSVLLSYKGENILIDCGEGTQRQFKMAEIPPTKITKLLITHWHPDHILGIPGLITTLGANEYTKTLEIYGPENTTYFFNNFFKAYVPKTRIKTKITEIRSGKFFENEDFYLESLQLNHGMACLGYNFVEKDKRKINLSFLKKFNLEQHPILKQLQQGKDIVWKDQKIKVSEATTIKKGKKITFILDTKICNNIFKLSENSDLLVCESTNLDELKEKTEKYNHLTAKQAAEIAKKSKVKKLVLTHFSQRYKDSKEMKEEAQKIFKNTVASEDLMQISP